MATRYCLRAIKAVGEDGEEEEQLEVGRLLPPIFHEHSVIFLGEMQTKFYCKNIGTIVIFDKKMFKFLCHMIGSNHY